MVWVSASLDAAGRLHYRGWSDSEVTRGLLALLSTSLSGCTPEEVVQVGMDAAAHLGPPPPLCFSAQGGMWEWVGR
jgi:sulfur transfer protein SufE